MGKIKVSCKELKERFDNVIVAGYCDLQDLLSQENAVFYNCGVYGWNFDVYIIDNETIIITGYRNLNGNLRNYDITRKYNELARIEKQKYYYNNLTYEQMKENLNKLIKDYVKEMKEKNK